MAYAGLPPATFTNNLTNVQLVDDISGSFNGSTQTFALTSSSAPFHAVSARSLIVVLGGIVQKPQVDYTVDGANITFTTAPVSGLTFAARNIYGLNYLNNVNDGVITPAKLTTGGPSWDTSGTLTAGSFIPTSSTVPTNGLYSPGTNQLALSTNGTGRLFVDASGNVGVNTATPTEKLDVNGTIKTTNINITGSLLSSDVSNFTGDVKIGTKINITSYDNLNNGTISFEGSAGQLFSITNTLTTGSIFSVNDVSGIPSIDVDADGTISLAPYSGVVVLKQVSETVANAFNTTLVPSSGTLTIDTSVGTVVLGDINASVTTWAFTNVPTGNSLATTVTVIIDGDTAETYGDACSVNGTAVTNGIKWAGGAAPSASNNFDIITFTIINDSAGTVNVFGSATMNYS